MSNKKYWLVSGFYSMFHRGADFIFGFIGFMLLVRMMPVTDFGVWVLFITIISIVDMARNGFLQNGLIKFLLQYPLRSNQIQTAAITVNLLMTFLFMLLIWLSASTLEHWLNAKGLAQLLIIYSWVLPLLILHTHNLILLQASYNFKGYFFAGVAKSFPLFIVIVIFYLSHQSLTMNKLAWWYNLCWAIAAFTSLWQVRKVLNLSFKREKYWLHRQIHFGKYVFATNLLSTLSNSMDKFFLGALLSSVQVAWANAAGRVMNMIEIPVSSLASVAYPKISEAYEQNNKIKVAELYQKTVGMMLSLTVPFYLVVMIFAKFIILIIAGNEYLVAVPFLRITALLALLKPFDRQTGVFLDAIGKPQLNTIMVISNFVITIICSTLFIKFFGFIGAAMGLTVALLLSIILKVFTLKKYININLIKPWKEIIPVYQHGWDMIKQKLPF